MSYTHPHGQPQGKANLFINKIREALIGEIIAINGYATHIANSNMESINIMWKDIMREEKEHYGMFLNLVRKYDPDEYKQYLEHMDDKIGVSPMQMYKPSYDKQLILNNIREDIKGELEAIILYEEVMGEMPYQDIKDVFEKIIVDEKEHTEKLTNMLLQFDHDKYNGIS